MMVHLTQQQQEAVHAPTTSFLLGSAGCGKTTALQARLLQLLQAGENAYTLMVLVAEPEHADGFTSAVHASGLGPYADLKITTYNQLAQEMTTLFWPLVARSAGFERPFQPPTILSYDLAQLLMWSIVNPMKEQGAFADLRLRPQQIVSQLLDTLNRAALNGLSLEQAIIRQKQTWVGDDRHLKNLDQAEIAVRAFRDLCLQNSLLDLSLVIQVFDTQLVRHPEFQRYFSERFRHLIIDNIEEQTPAGQNFIEQLMYATKTTAIAYDGGGGYKRFLAADPTGASRFYHLCQHQFTFTESLVVPAYMQNIATAVENFLQHKQHPHGDAQIGILDRANGRYRREMLQELIPMLKKIMQAHNLPPSEIAIIVPYLDGALHYTLTHSLREQALPYFLLRRRSSPREEPRIRAWLTWLALANPHWDKIPTPFDVAEALTLSVNHLDPARASLLVNAVYDETNGRLLPTFDHLPDSILARVGKPVATLLEQIRLWLEDNHHLPLDIFLHRLFAHLLSQPRFQPEPDLVGAAVCDWLVRSATRLRQSAPAMGLHTPDDIGIGFLDGIYQGLVTANPPDLGDPPDPNGIMISSIYGYLLAGKSVAIQVWLETSAQGWWDIPNQPLSNAFILAQSRSPEELWTATEEFEIRNQLLARLVRGLTNRCTHGIVLATSDLDRRGQRQDGSLWRALQPLLTQQIVA